MSPLEMWQVTRAAAGRSAVRVDPINTDETERLLEDLLASTPELLGRELLLIGRQLATESGPLDLLALDSDGQLVVFELKRGVLTRDAVAQVVDYASYISALDEEKLARLIEGSSGRHGIAQINDFQDWYGGEYPDSDGVLARPAKMVIVGLGADDRARRMVTFLNQRGVDIQLLTFQAFRSGSELFLTKEVPVSVSRRLSSASENSKEGNRRILHQRASELGSKEFLESVASFLLERLPGAYQWPAKTAYSFSLPGQTQEGRSTARAYATLYIDVKTPGQLLLNLTPNAAEAAPDAVSQLARTLPDASRDVGNSKTAVQLRLTPGVWDAVRRELDPILRSVYEGWQRHSAALQQSEAAAAAAESENDDAR
jgi:hypothetical protein